MDVFRCVAALASPLLLPDAESSSSVALADVAIILVGLHLTHTSMDERGCSHVHARTVNNLLFVFALTDGR